MATMLEVAKRAGVSKATVSRVLSGNGYVSQETKDRVFQAVAESGYRPNLLARNLATKKSQTLGLVVTNTLYHGVYFSELLFQVARMTEDKGRQLILATASTAPTRSGRRFSTSSTCAATRLLSTALSERR
ncbi:Cryptic asc operon repressor [Raoultella terrigena]|uniref:Cryptic asc operon repressor n=1 Tax=Raoultella terrigena TaxID=577 RepID=A0A4U9D0H8_RAOTE|nr:Cryptic asc operon repressor [Raoultella terrigena]